MGLYAALTFWLLVIVFAAGGVHRIWSGLVKPRVVNAVLLPGTLVAQLGHVLGLLITGNSVRNTKLMGDDEAGTPRSEPPDERRVPVLGPILVGLLPLLACGAGLCAVTHYWGGDVLAGLQAGTRGVPTALPSSLAGVGALLRDAVWLIESLVNAIHYSHVLHWTTLLFLYLAVCLTVRMAPFEGNRRGSLGAIVLAGIVIAIIDLLPTGARGFVLSSWPMLSFAVAMLLLLLLLSLLAAGIVGLVRILAGKE